MHQKNILEVLSSPTKLDKDIRHYLNQENKYTDFFFSDTKKLQKKLFNEIKGRIKLADKSVIFKDKRYIYWTKTTEKGKLLNPFKKKISTLKGRGYMEWRQGKI